MARAEERLLAVVHALLHRCYKMPFSNNAEVHPSLKKELGGAAPGAFPCTAFPLELAVMPFSSLPGLQCMSPKRSSYELHRG